MDTSQIKKMRRFRRAFRFIGAMFVLIGGMILFDFTTLLFDPKATIIINGVATSDFNQKLYVVIFQATFFAVGLVALFGPSRMFNKLFLWRLSFLSLFTLKRR
ncbi:MAG TPA: hypothetical protein VNF46_01825 [Gammaproteobacteria bacterium]|nr:hypothetical protein [Gammaproteobacteria bacterium]